MEKIEVLKSLREYGSVSFATVSIDGKAKSRTFDVMDYDEDYLYFLTGGAKTVCKEIEANPFVSLNVFANQVVDYRIEGEVKFEGDRDYLLSINPKTAKMYEGKEDALVAFKVKLSMIKCIDFSNGKPDVSIFRIK